MVSCLTNLQAAKGVQQRKRAEAEADLQSLHEQLISVEQVIDQSPTESDCYIRRDEAAGGTKQGGVGTQWYCMHSQTG